MSAAWQVDAEKEAQRLAEEAAAEAADDDDYDDYDDDDYDVEVEYVQ